MNIYGEITKVEALDDGTIRVTGVASTGAIDDADERVLPEAMKAALPAYMRFGALREMHGLSAAGATLRAEVTDDGATRIETHVVDPVITKLRLNEISLVDRPCNPEAVIDVWKADRPEGPTNAEVLAKAEAMARESGLPGRRSQFVVKARKALLGAHPGNSPSLRSDDDGENIAADDPFDADAGDDTGMDDNPDTDPAVDDNADTPPSLMDLLDQLEDQLDALPDDEAWRLISELATRWSSAPLEPKAATHDDLRKLEADNARLRHALAIATPRIDALEQNLTAIAKRLEAVAAEPAAPRAVAGRIRAVSKAEDAGDDPDRGLSLSAEDFRKYLDTLPEEERGRLQLRAALSQPIHIAPR